MIEPNQSDIGLKVIFRVHGSAKVEEGVITRLNKKYVFVRFGKEEKSTAMTRDDWSGSGRDHPVRLKALFEQLKDHLRRKAATASAAIVAKRPLQRHRANARLAETKRAADRRDQRPLAPHCCQHLSTRGGQY